MESCFKRGRSSERVSFFLEKNKNIEIIMKPGTARSKMFDRRILRMLNWKGSLLDGGRYELTNPVLSATTKMIKSALK